MKQKRFFIFLFLWFVLFNVCKAKDSTFAFRTSIGISYTHLRMQKSDFSEKTGQYNWNDTSLRFGENKGASPIIKIGIQKSFKKWLRAEMNLSYNYGKIAYTTHFNTPIIKDNPGFSGTAKRNLSTNKYTLWAHNITLSIGPTFHYKHAYLSPQLNVNYYIYDIRNTRTQTEENYIFAGSAISLVSSSSNENSIDSKERGVHLSGGLTMGYNFKIKKINSFVEVGGNFQNNNTDMVRNVFNTFLAFGIRL